MSFMEDTHTEVDFSPEITVKRELDDFDNGKITNEIDGDWDQKPTIEILGHIKSEEDNLETQTEVKFSLKEDLLTVQDIAVKSELDDLDNGKTENEVDQKSTIKSEEKTFIDQYLISHEDVNIKSDDDVEQSDNWLKHHKVNYKSKHQLKMHKCPDCPYQSKLEGNIKKHSIRHKKPDEIVWHRCRECPYKTEQMDKLKLHVVGHIKNQFFKCTQCAYQTKRQLNLTKHQLKHESTDKRHECPQCPFKSIREGNLKRHVRVHANPKNI